MNLHLFEFFGYSNWDHVPLGSAFKTQAKTLSVIWTPVIRTFSYLNRFWLPLGPIIGLITLSYSNFYYWFSEFKPFFLQEFVVFIMLYWTTKPQLLQKSPSYEGSVENTTKKEKNYWKRKITVTFKDLKDSIFFKKVTINKDLVFKIKTHLGTLYMSKIKCIYGTWLKIYKNIIKYMRPSRILLWCTY